MRKHRILIAVFLAFWLAVGPAAVALEAAGQGCEHSASSVPVQDCCGDEVDYAACTSGACGVVVPAGMADVVPAPDLGGRISFLTVRYAGLAGPPDQQPPKAFVS